MALYVNGKICTTIETPICYQNHYSIHNKLYFEAQNIQMKPLLPKAPIDIPILILCMRQKPKIFDHMLPVIL